MPRVVIAEDHEVVRDGLRRTLEAHGCTVVGEVGDGLCVLEIVERTNPDVLLLDFGLTRPRSVAIVGRLVSVSVPGTSQGSSLIQTHIGTSNLRFLPAQLLVGQPGLGAIGPALVHPDPTTLISKPSPILRFAS